PSRAPQSQGEPPPPKKLDETLLIPPICVVQTSTRPLCGERAISSGSGMRPCGVSRSTKVGSDCESCDKRWLRGTPVCSDKSSTVSGPSACCNSCGAIDWLGPVPTHEPATLP